MSIKSVYNSWYDDGYRDGRRAMQEQYQHLQAQYEALLKHICALEAMRPPAPIVIVAAQQTQGGE